jgi:hypothetical protein
MLLLLSSLTMAYQYVLHCLVAVCGFGVETLSFLATRIVFNITSSDDVVSLC